MVKIAIQGAAGRMGQRLVALCVEQEGLELVGALEHIDHLQLGQDTGVVAGIGPTGVALAAELDRQADVLIDFTIPAAMRAVLETCVKTKTAMVIGTTGLSDQDHRAIDDAAKTVAILQAPNMSLGVNLMIALAGQVAKQLGDDYDIEITEAHHRFKKDAPSGTAVGIAKAICQATGKDMTKDVTHGRHGDDVTRKRGQIGMHALRMGDVVGEHTVSYAALGERLELRHVATTRDVFVRGALKAAKWLAGKEAGRYGMADVLGLS